MQKVEENPVLDPSGKVLVGQSWINKDRRVVPIRWMVIAIVERKGGRFNGIYARLSNSDNMHNNYVRLDQLRRRFRISENPQRIELGEEN